MIITKHGAMRFKQRQKIKNNAEMQRKTARAIKRGKLLTDVINSPGINCYLYNGFYYLVSDEDSRLVTVFRPNKPKNKAKKLRLEDIKIKEFYRESRNPCIAL